VTPCFQNISLFLYNILHKYDIHNVIFLIWLKREEKNEKNTTESNECKPLGKAGKIVCNSYDIHGCIQFIYRNYYVI
jgi:hypothetical protein